MARQSAKAKKMCTGVSEKYRQQAITLAGAVLQMQKKIESIEADYETADVTQEITKTNGTVENKANPLLVEFRALVKDYAIALKNLQNLIEYEDVSESESGTSLNEIRKGLRICQ